MKLNKNLLKSIVKECLVEILAEGLIPGGQSSHDKRLALKESVGNSSKRKIQKRNIERNTSNTLQTRGSYLDQVSYNNGDADREREDRTKKLVSGITSDPIMSEIFADTANSTLIEQKESAGRASPPSRPADQAARIVAESDPSDLFGSSSGKWADLAFAPKLQK